MGNSTSTHSFAAPEVLTSKNKTAPTDDILVGAPNVSNNHPTPMVDDNTTVFEKSKAEANQTSGNEMEKYNRFRTEMFAYMLGEAAYDYAEKLYKQHPDDPHVMAYLTETIWLYEKKKIERKRAHWIDRLDILQRGIDVSRKCIEEHPDFVPCYRNYSMIALKMSDQLYFWRWMRGMGTIENYSGIMKRGQQALEKTNGDFELALGLAEINARSAQKWYSPYRPYGLWYGIPERQEMLKRAAHFHKMAFTLDPSSMENCCRTAMVLMEQGKMNEARRWYIKVRDAMVPKDPKDDVWQAVAHTHLCMRFQKNTWNAASG